MTEQEIEIEDLRAAVDLLVASGRTTALLITKALDHLKQAHQAAHQGNAMETLDHLALAMAVLAQA